MSTKPDRLHEKVTGYVWNAPNNDYKGESPQVEEPMGSIVAKQSSANTSEDVVALFAADRLAESRRYFVELDPAAQSALFDRYNEQQDTVMLNIFFGLEDEEGHRDGFLLMASRRDVGQAHG